jgi:hypothetical protein
MKKIFIIDTSKPNIIKNTSNSYFQIKFNMEQLLNEMYNKYDKFYFILKSITTYAMNSNDTLFTNMQDEDKSFKIMIKGLPFVSAMVENSNLNYEQLLTNFKLDDGKDFDNPNYLEFYNNSFVINKQNNCFIEIKYLDFTNNELEPNAPFLNLTSEQDVYNSAIAYYPFATNTHDFNIGNHDLDNINIVTFGTVDSRDCATFDGTNYFELPTYNNFIQQEQITIVCWVKFPSNSETRATIFSLTDTTQDIADFGYYVCGVNQNNGQIYQILNDNSPITSNSQFSNDISINDDNWHHLVFIYGKTGSNFLRSLYVDGVLNEQLTNGKTLLDISPNNLRVGSRLIYDVPIVVLSEDNVLLNSFSYYPTESTNVENDAKNNYDGTLINGASYALLSSRNSLSLNGTNQYMDLTTHIANFINHFDFTLSGWIFTNSTNTMQTILSLNNDTNTEKFIISVLSDQTMQINKNGTTVVSSSGITLNAWNHFCCEFGISGNKIYVNNVLVYNSGTGSIGSGFNKLYIAADGLYTPAFTSAFDTLMASANLTHRFLFQNGSLAVDSTTPSESGSVSGTVNLPTNVQNFNGKANSIYFPGGTNSSANTTDGHLRFDSVATSFNNTETISFWFYKNSKNDLTVNSYIMSVMELNTLDRFDMYILQTTGQLDIVLREATAGNIRVRLLSDNNICDGQWHHCLFDCPNAYTRLYIDGVKQNTYLNGGEFSPTWHFNDINNENTCTIGGMVRNSTQISFRAVDMYLSNFCVFNKSLTNDEISGMASEATSTPATYNITNYFNGNMSKLSFYSQSLNDNDVDALFNETVQPVSQGFIDDEFYEGSISKLSIYDKALNSDEISALYNERVNTGGASKYPDMKYTFEIQGLNAD